MRLFGLSKASTLDWSRSTGWKDQAWHCLSFCLISSRARTWIKSLKNKCSIEEKLSRSSYSNLFPLSHNEQLIIWWLQVHQHTQGNKLLPIQSISSSHRAQVVTSCSTSLQQIVSVADKATLLFSVERISEFGFFCGILVYCERSASWHVGAIVLIWHVAQPFCNIVLSVCLYLPLLNMPQLRIQGKELVDSVSDVFHCFYVCVFQFIFSVTLTAIWIWAKRFMYHMVNKHFFSPECIQGVKPQW